MIRVLRFEVRVFPTEDWKPDGQQVAMFASRLREYAGDLGYDVGISEEEPALDLVEPRDILYGHTHADDLPFTRGSL